MSETPKAAQNGQETPTQSRSAYLPVLPDGWSYTVAAKGPDMENITVSPSTAQTLAAKGEYDVAVSGGGTTKRFAAASLKDAVRAAVDAAKALTAIAEHEKKAAAAKEALLAAIGRDAATEPEPEQKPEQKTAGKPTRAA